MITSITFSRAGIVETVHTDGRIRRREGNKVEVFRAERHVSRPLNLRTVETEYLAEGWSIVCRGME